MTIELIERLSSDDLKENLDALSEVIYQISERHGGCYVTACRSNGYDFATATADPTNSDDFVYGDFRPERQVVNER
jgi:hypothetical protein